VSLSYLASSLGVHSFICGSEMALNLVLLCVSVYLFAITTTTIVAEDPYRFFNWNVTYGDIYPLGVRQQVYLCLNSHFHPYTLSDLNHFD